MFVKLSTRNGVSPLYNAEKYLAICYLIWVVYIAFHFVRPQNKNAYFSKQDSWCSWSQTYLNM